MERIDSRICNTSLRCSNDGWVWERVVVIWDVIRKQKRNVQLPDQPLIIDARVHFALDTKLNKKLYIWRNNRLFLLQTESNTAQVDEGQDRRSDWLRPRFLSFCH